MRLKTERHRLVDDEHVGVLFLGFGAGFERDGRRVGAVLVGTHDRHAKAKEENADVLIIDTAGRLQNKSNLMDELGKIRRILINKCNDILRAGQRTVFTDEPLEIEYMENEFLNLEWKEMLQSLDEKYRIVLLLYYGEGFSIKEIAQILELTESAIKSRLSRGREQVKQEYNAGGICHEKS